LSLLPHRAIQRWHDQRENNEINRLDKLGNTSRHSFRHAADVVGGPRLGTTNDGGSMTLASGGEDHRW